MKITALGVHSAFATGEVHSFKKYKDDETIDVDLYDPKFQSNFLIEFKTKGKIKDDIFRLVIDFGSDIRHSLAMIGLKMSDIDAWYCSHPHADHIGGVEGIALSTFFNPFWNKDKKQWAELLVEPFAVVSAIEKDPSNQIPNNCKPSLYAHCAPTFLKDQHGNLILSSVMKDIWDAAKPGLETLQGTCGMNVQLDTYFDLKPMFDNKPIYFEDGEQKWKVYTVISTHVMQGTKMMPSYGLMFESDRGTKVYMPTDTQLMAPPQIETFYKRADVIFQDCETGPRSNVHPHIDDLKKLDPELKRKMLLYHYTDKPIVEENEFKKVLMRGDVFTF